MNFGVFESLPASGRAGRPLNPTAQQYVEAVHANEGKWVSMGPSEDCSRTTLHYYARCFRGGNPKFVKEGYHAEAQIRDYKLYTKVEKK